MTVTINSEPYEIPFDPELITLQQYTDFYNQYGKDIDTELFALAPEDEYGADKLMDKEACAWFQFHTGYELTTEHAEPFLLAYRMLRSLINTIPADYPLTFDWNDEPWEIQTPVINAASQAIFNEIVTSKYAMQLVREAGAGKWDALLYLSAIFYRRQGESFTDELVQDESERLELLRTMPLFHAAAVGFFLSDCVTIWKDTFPYLAEVSGKVIGS